MLKIHATQIIAKPRPVLAANKRANATVPPLVPLPPKLPPVNIPPPGPPVLTRTKPPKLPKLPVPGVKPRSYL